MWKTCGEQEKNMGNKISNMSIVRVHDFSKSYLTFTNNNEIGRERERTEAKII